MIRYLSLLVATAVLPLLVLSIPSSVYHPVVIWHGLGDSYGSDGMRSVEEDIRSLYPGILVYSIRIDDDQGKDRKAGFFGNVNAQIELVAEQLGKIDDLVDGFDAIGFSQGGQFLRAYTEAFNDPPVHNLITFGSQHMGIADLPGCKPNDLVCKVAFSAARRSVYSTWAQAKLVQAQYYRDQDRLPLFLETNTFIADINNERPEKNLTYAANLATISNLVLYRFTKEATVVPAISSWFGSLKPLDNSSAEDGVTGREEIAMEDQELYREDWIGLRELDERDGVVQEWCEGEHMELSGCWKQALSKYVGSKYGEDVGWISRVSGRRRIDGLLVE